MTRVGLARGVGGWGSPPRLPVPGLALAFADDETDGELGKSGPPIARWTALGS